jgi:hypothetical protein
LNAEPVAATLRRVGWALIALGVLDIAVWLYGLAHGFPTPPRSTCSRSRPAC